MARLTNWLRLAAMIGAAAILAVPSIPAVAGVDLPRLEKGKGEKCVEDTQFMRRNHMDLLKHHRDETMRKGIRTTRHSLKKCVECHVSEKTGSVASSKEDFCAACHSYASVKLDCWDCHATKPPQKGGAGFVSAKALTTPLPGKKPQTQVSDLSVKPVASPLMASSMNGGSK